MEISNYLKKNLTKKNIFIAGVIICSILVFRYLALQQMNVERRKILENKGIAVGIIIDYEESGDAGSSIVYSFKYNGIKYTGRRNPQFNHRGKFINRYFPVIFSTSEPEINRMLIVPSNFEFFNMAFPDSLAWVKEYEQW
jgi:hypothetical protein